MRRESRSPKSAMYVLHLSMYYYVNSELFNREIYDLLLGLRLWVCCVTISIVGGDALSQNCLGRP